MIDKYPTNWKIIINTPGCLTETCEEVGDIVKNLFVFPVKCPQCKTHLRYIMNTYRRRTYSKEGTRYETTWQDKTTGTYEQHYCVNCDYTNTYYVGDY